MECPYCGASVNDTARFCEYCGKSIEDARGDSDDVKIARMKHEEEMEKLKQDALDREFEREPSSAMHMKMNLIYTGVGLLLFVFMAIVAIISK